MDHNALKDLWIGDLVRVTKTGAIGKFEGETGGKARILLDGRHMLMEARDIEVHDEPESEESLVQLLGIEEQKIKEKKRPSMVNVLDLHLEKLSGYTPNSGLTILDYQLKECRKFLEEVIARKYLSATIIHGKGEGILRDQVIHLLKEFPQVRNHFPKNHGGALEILLFY